MGRSRLRDIVIDCTQPSAVAAFWSEALGYPVRPYDDAQLARLKADGINDIADAPSVQLLAPDGGPGFWFQRVPESKTVKNRVHIEITLGSDGALDRLVSLGATILLPFATTPHQRWTLLADPEGNEFCAFPADS